MRRFIFTIIVIALLLITAVLVLNNLYLDFLWFKEVNYTGVFLTTLITQWGVRIITFLIFFLFIFVNLLLTKEKIKQILNRTRDDNVIDISPGGRLSGAKFPFLFAIASAVLSLVFTSFSGGYWLEIQKFLHRSPFGTADPVFSKDIGFYVFQLPFYQFLYQFLLMMVAASLILVFVIYFISNPVRHQRGRWNFIPDGQKHLSFLLALVFFLKAWGYRLQMYNLLYSPRGVAFGASYTDIHAQLPGLRILYFIALFLGVMLILNIFVKKPKILVFTFIGLIGASFILGQVYPSIIQRLRVEPNEFNREKPYIENNIKFTQMAYGLDKIERKVFQVEDGLTEQDIQKYQGTLNNVRLWDYRPLQATFSQLQEIRPYYKFKQIDTDRYFINGVYRQVMLSVRELDQTRIDQRWVNKRLQYTHGYGLVISPVDEVTSSGLPVFFIRNIPPAVSAEGLSVESPEIYYGEMTDEYVIVKTDIQEFNYPKGESNAYTRYEGSGGIPIGNFFRRLLFALRFGDYKIVFSGNITPESRIMFDRNINSRIRKIAPFLIYDSDPYIVLNDGKLYWIRDAYTVTDMFPYSEPYKGINYIRNSVKVVVDAYNGSVDFYLIDEDEPVAKTLSKIFPELFKPFAEMPAGLKEHIRYPEDLFKIQSQMYLIYHMNDPKVFYNKEDRWEIPKEVYAGDTIPVEPYYTIIQLPEEDNPEFVLMQPFSPYTKNVMISWMAGRCDGENYGRLILYLFPKDKLVYGPSQIEARIDQDSQISQQLTLWNQRGSRVIRGNLLVLPMANSILYVEPIFLQAEQSQLPELIRVIVAYKDVVVMERTLEDALNRVFTGQLTPIETQPPVGEEIETIEELIIRANDLFRKAQERQREGDWAGYGRMINELENVLRQLEERTKE